MGRNAKELENLRFNFLMSINHCKTIEDAAKLIDNVIDILEEEIEELDFSNPKTYGTEVWDEITRIASDIMRIAMVRLERFDFKAFDILNHKTYNRLYNLVPMACPRIGEFVGYKKAVWAHDGVYEPVIVTLVIPADAERLSAFGRKCRCSKAFVRDIRNYDNERVDSCESSVFNYFGHCTVYKIGEIVEPDSFHPDRFIECSHGIHFFMTFGEARTYVSNTIEQLCNGRC